MHSAPMELERAGEYNAELMNDRLIDTVSQLEVIIAGQFGRANGGNNARRFEEEGIVNRVGGRFKLSTLIQKRMVALNTG